MVPPFCTRRLYVRFRRYLAEVLVVPARQPDALMARPLTNKSGIHEADVPEYAPTPFTVWRKESLGMASEPSEAFATIAANIMGPEPGPCYAAFEFVFQGHQFNVDVRPVD